MKIVFMGTPDFSVPALQRLHDSGHEIVAVYTQPPRPAGRGKKERQSPVHAKALALGLEVKHPEGLKSEDTGSEFAALNADVAVVVAYGLLLPQGILDAPKLGCLNIHASLLPRWRGAAPIHRAILAGDAQTGISIMQMEKGLDTGPILLVEATDIRSDETTAVLHDRLSDIGAKLIDEAIKNMSNLTVKAQLLEGITYAAKIDKSEAHIDWSQTAEAVDRQIRGLSPFPGAWTFYEGERLKCLASEVVKAQTGLSAAGQVLNNRLEIACAIGAIRITRLQKAGRLAQNTDEFMNGADIKTGDRFE
ncbi:MAG: methionyl-tRNA formyltransferase [Paracoccaceae bacterium]|nr:methionyl-tRNA formyltransferase [Paracoccaceae bacterium]